MISFPQRFDFAGTQVGRPANRVDGALKVTGAAKYAADFAVARALLHGFVVSSAIARGRIVRIDTTEARTVPGVVEVFTHENRPDTAWLNLKYRDQDAPLGWHFRPLHDGAIHFSDQPVAFVVAATRELAQHAASLVRVEYAEEPSRTNLRPHLASAREPRKFKPGFKAPPEPRGRADEACMASPVRLDAEYHSPVEHHNALELHATTAVHEGRDRLTIHDKTQGVTNILGYVTRVFGLPKKNVRVISPFVGGAFGSGLRPQHQLFLTVMAALALQRSVRCVLTRQQTFTLGHRPETVQRIALGAGPDGRLRSIIHEVVGHTSQFEDYIEIVANWSTLMYRSEHARQSYRLLPSDIFTPLDMRAPGGVLGMYAIETAMDELAAKVGVDPLELRLRNYTDRDPNHDVPFSSKELRACFKEGARRFGWASRPPEPRSMRAGRKLVGWGLASGVWEAMQVPAGARVTLGVDGRIVVESATADIGTGTYTIMTQIAADTLSVPLEEVTFRLGDSKLPYDLLEGGSWTATSVGSAVKAACEKLKAKLISVAASARELPLRGVDDEEIELADGRLRAKSDPARAVTLRDLAAVLGEPVSVKTTVAPRMRTQKKWGSYTHSAVFAEVQVDEDLGRVQVTRVVSAVAGGRILNPKTARSQVMGGVVWGIGMALEEETLMDHHLGRFMNHSLAEYHVPVHADIRDIEVIFVPEEDRVVSPIGAKGLGEIGIVGVAAAIGNAVFHATGTRVRDLPITLDKLL